MIIKQTIRDKIEIERDGTIFIRFAKEVVEDGIVIASEWHRTSIAPGQDLTFTMQQVNAHLSSMGKAQVQPEELTILENIIPVVQTVDVIAEFNAKQKIKK